MTQNKLLYLPFRRQFSVRPLVYVDNLLWNKQTELFPQFMEPLQSV